MVNPFVGASREDLEKWLRAAQRELATGKVESAWTGGDTSSSKYVFADLDPRRRIELILQELNRMWPDAYPNATSKKVTRTRMRFNTYHPAPGNGIY
jgi:hypothetical protein